MIISNGMPPPQPWDIVVQPMGLFRDEVKLIEIPNTAQVEVSNIRFYNRNYYCYLNILSL